MTHPPDNPFLGIVLMLGFCVLIPFSDALAKLLGQSYALIQLIAARFLAQAVVLTPFVLVQGRHNRLSTRLWAILGARAILQIIGIGLMFWSLRFLPLADAVAIAFVMPFMLLLLGWFFLGEQVGPHRLAACAVGFVGTLMVVQPSFAALGAAAFLPFGVAIAFSVYMLVTRHISRDVDPVKMQAITGVLGLPFIVVLAGFPILGDPGFGDWPIPMGWDIVLFICFACVGVVGHLFMTWSLRFAPSASLAPMQYLEIPIAALVGLAVFGEFPNGLALAGIGVTIAAGLYIIARERMASRQV